MCSLITHHYLGDLWSPLFYGDSLTNSILQGYTNINIKCRTVGGVHMDERIILYLSQHVEFEWQMKIAGSFVQFVPERIASILMVDKSSLHQSEYFKEYATLDVPVCDLSEVEQLDQNLKVLMGVATRNGLLEGEDQVVIDTLVKKGFSVINMLHSEIVDCNSRIINYRQNQVEDTLAHGEITHKGKRVLFVGTDFAIGKMTSCIALCHAMKTKGYDVEWIPTGQIGKLIGGGRGLVLDSMVIDFMPGNLEHYINQQKAEILLIEGQGSIFHQAYSPTSFGLFHASQPQYLIVCDKPSMKYGYKDNLLPSVGEAIGFYENLGAMLGIPAKVIGVALNTKDMDEQGYMECKMALEQELDLPCCDVMRENPLCLIRHIESI